MKKLFYRIGEACKQLDIQPYVLRYWETEFPVLSPKKSKAGQRVYSEEELRLILRIKQLLYEEGYTIAGAKKKLDAELAADTLPELDTGSDAAPEPSRAAGEAAAAPAADADVASAPADAAAAAVRPDPAAAEPGATPPAQAAPGVPDLDRASVEQVETLRSGLREALAQARDILRLLGD